MMYPLLWTLYFNKEYEYKNFNSAFLSTLATAKGIVLAMSFSLLSYWISLCKSLSLSCCSLSQEETILITVTLFTFHILQYYIHFLRVYIYSFWYEHWTYVVNIYFYSFFFVQWLDFVTVVNNFSLVSSMRWMWLMYLYWCSNTITEWHNFMYKKVGLC